MSSSSTEQARQKPDHPLIGLSVSFCVLDIVTGIVDIKNVVEIVGGTKAVTPEHWEEIIENYKQSYWHQFPDEAERVIRQLLAEGKIKQPRIAQDRCPRIQNRIHWVNSEKEIRWCRAS